MEITNLWGAPVSEQEELRLLHLDITELSENPCGDLVGKSNNEMCSLMCSSGMSLRSFPGVNVCILSWFIIIHNSNALEAESA